MPAVESLLQLYNLDEQDGTITAFDSYGSDVHLGTSSGLLIHLTVSEAAAASQRNSEESFALPGRGGRAGDAEASPVSPSARSSPPVLLRTTVSRRCTLSATGTAVQQLQHSRSQRVVFVLCEGRLLLVHAETYAVLSSIATNVVSFSVAQPVRAISHNSNGACVAPSATTPYRQPVQSRQHCGWTAATGEDEMADQHSRTVSHIRTSSEGSYGSSQPWTPRSSVAYPASPTTGPAAGPQHKTSKAHVVCVAEKNKKELAVYLVDRVSTSGKGGATAPQRPPTSCSPSTTYLTSGGSNDTPSSATLRAAVVAPSPPRVVLRQRYVLPEPAQRLVMCTPFPLLPPPPVSSARTASPSSAAAVNTVVEAGLTVCVGMRREVSLLPLLGGVPRCVLRLDGSLPPLVSTGSDHNTYLVRTQAPNTVMEVGVPPSAAAAGLRSATTAGGAELTAALVNPILLRMGYHRMSGVPGDGDGQRRPLAASSLVQAGKEDDLIMGDVFQSDAVVELVLARFPFVFLFTAEHCDVVSLLGEGSVGSSGGNRTSLAPPSSSSLSSAVQRIPLPGVRHGALRGQGKSLFVASSRTVWALQLYPLRTQLAEMVHAGRSEEAFQLLAFHQQRALCMAEGNIPSRGGDAKQQPLALLERDLHRMVGFARLYSGDVTAAVRALRGYLDPRELLLALPDCIPPYAMAHMQPSATTLPAAPTKAEGEAEEDGDTAAAPSPVRATAAARARERQENGSDGGYTLRDVDAVVSAAQVRSFLYADEDPASPLVYSAWPPPLRHSCNPDQKGTQRSGETQWRDASYWAHWGGPSIYNTSADDVSRAWRSTFAASLTAATATVADAFVSSCYDALKEEVRRWFAEVLLLPAAVKDNTDTPSATASPWKAPKSGDAAETGCRTSTQLDDTTESGPLFLSPSPSPHACTLAQRRAMAYASLVLAWQAQDFHTAYEVVACAAATELRVEDCAELLCYLSEYRLLALLCFQAGNGEACVSLLKTHVCLFRTLMSPAAADAHLLLLRQPTYVQVQLTRWRRCMEEKFILERTTPGGLEKQSEGSAPPFLALASSPATLSGGFSRDTLVCGRGLWMQSSPALVARVAQALFGVYEDEPHSFASTQHQQQQGWAPLLEQIASFYNSQANLASSAAHSTSSFAWLHFFPTENSSAARLTLPHRGPVLTTTTATVAAAAAALPTPPPPAAPRLQIGNNDRGGGVAVVNAAGVRVLPSPLSEYFYAVEKLDLRTVRRLLASQPRLVLTQDVDGCTGLHIALAQVRMVASLARSSSSTARPQLHEHERTAVLQSTTLQVICALVGVLVHAGCPTSTLNCNGWSCLDVAAVACGECVTVFDVVSAALLAAVELRKAELTGS